MRHRRLGERVLARIDRGEELLSSLTAICQELGIQAATLTGIGAVRDAELAFYDLRSHSYQPRTVSEICELVSLLGNVALVDGEPFVHAHAVLGRRDLSLIGGHLVRATVAVTAEVTLEPFDAPLERALDPEVRLKLLDL